MNRVIYISGPITGHPDGNRESFKVVCAELKAKGLFVRNPHEFCSDIPEGSDWEIYMRRCIVKLMECTDLILLPGWQKSKGAWIEARLAKELGITVHPTLKLFENSIDQQQEQSA